MKKYVNPSQNKCPDFLRNHIKLGDNVVIKDGSYMCDSHLNKVSGRDFQKNDKEWELLKVIAINTPFPTADLDDVLATYNNCAIEGKDGKIYYCSKINLVRFKH